MRQNRRNLQAVFYVFLSCLQNILAFNYQKKLVPFVLKSNFCKQNFHCDHPFSVYAKEMLVFWKILHTHQMDDFIVKNNETSQNS